MDEGKENGPVGPDPYSSTGLWGVLFGEDGRFEAAEIGGEPQHRQRVNHPLGGVEIVPAWSVAVITGIGVVIVVVSLAKTQEGHKPAVTATVMFAIRLCAEHVAERVNGKGRIQHHEHAEHPGQEKTADPADHPGMKKPEDEWEG